MAGVHDRWIVTDIPKEENDYRMCAESSILRWWHIPPSKNVTVTIDRVQKAKDKKLGKVQYLLWLRGKELPYLTNATARKTLGKLYGKDAHDWAGKRLTFFRTTTEMEGETVPCIRIRPQIPGAKLTDTPIDESAKAPEEEQGESEPAAPVHLEDETPAEREWRQ